MPWSSTFSNILPKPEGLKELMVLKKFKCAAKPNELSIAHLGSASWGPLTRIFLNLSNNLLKKFSAEDPKDFSKIQSSFLNNQDDQIELSIAGRIVGTIKLEGDLKQNQNLRFKHHFVDKK